MITFIQPLALLALLVLIPLWLLAFAARRASAQRSPFAFWSGLLLSTAALVALTGALAGTTVALPERALTVIFLLDRSDSVAPADRARAEAYLQEALAALPTDDRAGVVVFGQRAEVAQLPSADHALAPIVATPNGGRTDIGAALQLALALLPPEGRRRIVLLSDGNQNQGDVAQAAQVAATRDVPLDVLPLASGAGGFDVQITGMNLPPRARQGQQLRLRIDTAAPAATQAHLVVSSGETRIVEQDVAVAAGRGELEVELPEPATGFNRYSVRLEVPNDARPQNNQAEAFSDVLGPPRVLLVASEQPDVKPLQDALQAASITTEVVTPGNLPPTLGLLSRYDAVVLVNLELGALPPVADTVLPAYVRDLGRGLAMIGGPRSLGAGGYRDSAIEGALPVTMNPRPNMQSPPAALVVLMDVSGSMAKFEGDSTKLQLAALGTARMAEQLRDDDTITVIPFDRMAMGTIGPLRGSERASIPGLLQQFSPGSGGINLFDGLQVARNYLDRADQKVRHLIVLTDGDDTTQKEGSEDLVRDLNAHGVTVTMLALGNGRDVQFIQGLARLGGGRFFLSQDAASLPTIMTDEARLVLRPYVIEGPFVPVKTTDESPILRDLGELPPLYGYVASQPKERATVLLKAANDDPLLATWQYGLGHSLVWTSDASVQWSRNLIVSPQFPLLAAQLVSWLLPPPQAERLALETRTEDNALLLTVTTADETGRTIVGLRVAGQLLDARGQGHSVLLRETSPGTYGALVPQLDAGSYAVQLVATDDSGAPIATTTGGAVLTDSSEYRDQQTNRQLLESIANLTGGRIDPPAAEVFNARSVARGRPIDLSRILMISALVLLPVTILVRRMRFRRAPLPHGVDLATLSRRDRAWLVLFGNAPFHDAIQRRNQRRSEQQAWAAWVHEQAEQSRRAFEETRDRKVTADE